MTEIDIEPALNTRLEEFNIAHPIDISYTNIAYTPEVGTDYIQVDFLPATPETPEVGIRAINRVNGLYSIIYNTQAVNGKQTLKEFYKNFKEYFKRSTAILYTNSDAEDIKVRILRLGLGEYIQTEDWFKQVIEVYFRSDLED